MTSARRTVLLLGASGYIGRDVLQRLLASDNELRVIAMVRDTRRWAAITSSMQVPLDRVTIVEGDLRSTGMGLSPSSRAMCGQAVTHLVHCAGDLVLSRPLADARATNAVGTRHLLDVISDWRRVERLLYVSTAFVAGRATGDILECDNGASAGWVNGYEQSKYEAEALVRGSDVPWVIARPSLILCDRAGGLLGQLNALHYAVRLWHSGLVPMMPGGDASVMDVASRDGVAADIVALLNHPAAEGATVHLCAGRDAMLVSDVLELAWQTWRTDPAWKRRAIPIPALVALETYDLLERSIAETADPLLQRIIRSLSPFAPTTAYPKTFDVRQAELLIPPRRVDVEALWRTVFLHVGRRPLANAAA